MEETVDIPVEIRGVERTFAARVQVWQYGVRFLIDVDDAEVIVERDEAGELRAILSEGFTGKPPDKEVISAIINVLQAL